MDQYNPADIALDATKFARSQFGKHYMLHLKRLKDYYIDIAINGKDREERADAGIVAAEYQKTIDYFVTQQTIASSPSILEKLRKAFKERMNKS